MKKTAIFSSIVALVLATSCGTSQLKKDVAAQQQTINKIQYEITRQAEELQVLQASKGSDSINGVAIKDIIVGQQYQLEQLNTQLTKARKDLYGHLNSTGAGLGMGTSQVDLTASCFAVGSAVLTKDATSLLDSIVPQLADNQLTVKVNGYTDDTGSDAINSALSLKRAESVKAYLAKKGVDAARITTEGFGPKNPVACNDNAEGRSRNRRVEVIINNQDQE